MTDVRLTDPTVPVATLGEPYASPALRYGFSRLSVPVIPYDAPLRCPSLDGERRMDRPGDHPAQRNPWLIHNDGPHAPMLLECGCGRVYAFARPPAAPAPAPAPGSTPGAHADALAPILPSGYVSPPPPDYAKPPNGDQAPPQPIYRDGTRVA